MLSIKVFLSERRGPRSSVLSTEVPAVQAKECQQYRLLRESHVGCSRTHTLPSGCLICTLQAWAVAATPAGRGKTLGPPRPTWGTAPHAGWTTARLAASTTAPPAGWTTCAAPCGGAGMILQVHTSMIMHMMIRMQKECRVARTSVGVAHHVLQTAPSFGTRSELCVAGRKLPACAHLRTHQAALPGSMPL